MLPAGGQDEVELLIYYASKLTSLCYGTMEHIPCKNPKIEVAIIWASKM